MKIQEIPCEERPREKALRQGIETLSNRELLAILIRTGTKNHSALDIADELLQKANGICNVASMSIDQMSAVKGMSKIRALEIKAALEISRHILYENVLQEENVIKSPQAMYAYLQATYGMCMHEEFLVACLDGACRVLDIKSIFKGTLTHCSVAPREIFRYAYDLHARGIILVHNHPNARNYPSNEDLEVTKKICSVGDLMEIEVMDHIIVDRSGCFSFAEHGLLG